MIQKQRVKREKENDIKARSLGIYSCFFDDSKRLIKELGKMYFWVRIFQQDVIFCTQYDWHTEFQN